MLLYYRLPEMCIARPSNLIARAQTRSNYVIKIKYLIATTHCWGVSISFVSPGWGGRSGIR